jgi:hypothetical protein
VYEIFNIKVLKGHDLEGNNKECGVSKTPTAGAPGSGKGANGETAELFQPVKLFTLEAE